MRTDHAPLKWLRNFKDADGMLARWLSVIECYDCVIEHRPGTKHRNADALSRLTCQRSDCPDRADSKQINNIQLNTLTEQNGSSNTNHAPSNWVDTWSHDDLDELLYRKSPVRNFIDLQLVASSTMKVEIFKQLHSIPIGGHFGRDRTIYSIKRRFYWPGMRNDIARWCNSYELCARSKPGPELGRNELQRFKSQTFTVYCYKHTWTPTSNKQW